MLSVDSPRSIELAVGLLGLVLLLGLALLLWRKRKPIAAKVTAEPFEHKTIEVGRWTWRYHVAGRGPTLVCLHGLGADLYCWRTLSLILREHYTILIPDLPGFGGSSKFDDERYGLDEQIERLTQFLDALNIRNAYVVGNSMGGNLALWLALCHPDRVKAVVAIAPAVSPSLVPFGLEYLHWAAHPLAYLATSSAISWIHSRTVSRRDLIDAERIKETLATYGGQQLAIKTLMRATHAIRDARLPAALAEVRPPALILWGSQDRLVSRKVIDGLENVLPNAKIYVHMGGGHHLQEDEPEWTAEKLTSFFDRLQD